jgi:hypothetical protein
MARRSIEGAAGIFVCKRIRHWATNTHGTVRPPKVGRLRNGVVGSSVVSPADRHGGFEPNVARLSILTPPYPAISQGHPI